MSGNMSNGQGNSFDQDEMSQNAAIKGSGRLLFAEVFEIIKNKFSNSTGTQYVHEMSLK